MINLQNIVSITDFRLNIASWLDKLSEPLIIIQNSKPKAVVVDPEYLEYLERYADGYYDAGDVAELKRAKANKEKLVPFDPSKFL